MAVSYSVLTAAMVLLALLLFNSSAYSAIPEAVREVGGQRTQDMVKFELEMLQTLNLLLQLSESGVRVVGPEVVDLERHTWETVCCCSSCSFFLTPFCMLVSQRSVWLRSRLQSRAGKSKGWEYPLPLYLLCFIFENVHCMA
jgi:hypothetical protein